MPTSKTVIHGNTKTTLYQQICQNLNIHLIKLGVMASLAYAIGSYIGAAAFLYLLAFGFLKVFSSREKLSKWDHIGINILAFANAFAGLIF